MKKPNHIIFPSIMLLMAPLLSSCFPPPPPPPPTRAAVSPNFNTVKYSKIAVLASSNVRADDGLLRRVEDESTFALISKGYQIASRSDVEHLMGEIKFQSSGITDSRGAALGKMLNVPGVFLITINEADVKEHYSQYYSYSSAEASVSGRFVDVETGEVMWIATENNVQSRYSSTDPTDVVEELTRRIAGAFPGRYAVPASTPSAPSLPSQAAISLPSPATPTPPKL